MSPAPSPPLPSASPSPSRAKPMAVALILLLALAAVGWLQLRQHRLLDATVRYQDDYLQLSISQLQVEFLRLRVALHEAAKDPDAARAQVQLRYDVFVSRIDLLSSGRAEHLVPDPIEIRIATNRLRAFVDLADTFLGPQATKPLDMASVQVLLEAMLPLDAPLQTLVLTSSHTLSMAVAERYEVMRDQGRLGAVLTAVLAATSVGFALVAFALLRRESLRRRSLEVVTGELREAQRQAESANQAKSAFMANMSHEIRTPFQGMLGMLQVMDSDALGPGQRRQLATVRGSAMHLLAVLDDILDMSRLEAGTFVLKSGPTDLRLIVEDVHALMSASAQAKGLRFDPPRIDPALPRLVMLDGTRLRQILFNLCSNAIKFTDRGAIDIELRVTGSTLNLSVTDTGIGIDDATRQHLFERFSLGDASRRRRYGGTGLGLYISRSLARLMDGDILLHEPAGAGCRFEVQLPIELPPEPGVDKAMPAAAKPAGLARPLHVLAAEDNEVNRVVLAAMLERQGHRVSFAHNGREAVEAMAKEAADLVLMDLHMPEMDGIDAARAIRSLAGPARQVPIVALTADVFPETRSLCLDAGIDDFLAKPVGYNDLVEVLARHASAVH